MVNLRNVFETINSTNIKYAVLRGYIPIEEIYVSKDIDIYVEKKDLKRFCLILEQEGFKTPKINAGKYPHIQYFYLSSLGMIKFDIVTELCFGEKLLTIDNSSELFEHVIIEEFIKVFNDLTALKLLVLHILLDKGEINIDNQQRICRLCSRNDTDFIMGFKGFTQELIKLCLNDSISSINSFIGEYSEKIILEFNNLKPRKDFKKINRHVNFNIGFTEHIEEALLY